MVWRKLCWWKGAGEQGDGEETCPICIETFGRWGMNRHVERMPCCKRRVCTTCVERHLQSIFEEVVTGAGRTALVCPLACHNMQQQIPDDVVRRVIRKQHFSPRHHIVGTYGMHPLARVVQYTLTHLLSHAAIWKPMSYAWILHHFSFSNHDHDPPRHPSQDSNMSQQYQSPTTRETMTLIQILSLTCATVFLWRFLAGVEQFSRSHDWWYQIWWYGTHGPSERRCLAQYDRWSLTVAYRSIVSGNNNNDDDDSSSSNHNKCVVMHCPAPDCSYTWFASQTYHSQKQVHETKHGTQSYSLMGRVSAKLFYSPFPPESSSSEHDDDDSEHPNNTTITSSLPWWTPQDVNLFDATRFHGNHNNDHRRAVVNRPEDHASEDGRRMECAKCRAVFCGLCLRPWVGRMYTGNNHSRLVKHEGRPCRLVQEKWGKHLNEDTNDYVYAAQAVGAKQCPGCSMRILRSDGCNHMTCPCGTHWCYVCECKWRHNGHYACYIGQPSSSSHSYCTIS